MSRRKGRGNRQFAYVEGRTAIDQANEIFGYGGWRHEVVGDVTLREIESVDPKTGEVKRIHSYSAKVRVTVTGAPSALDTLKAWMCQQGLDKTDIEGRTVSLVQSKRYSVNYRKLNAALDPEARSGDRHGAGIRVRAGELGRRSPTERVDSHRLPEAR